MRKRYFILLLFVFLSSPSRGEIIKYYEKPEHNNIKFVSVLLNDVPVEMIFDTGASTVVVNNDTFEKLNITSPLRKGTAQTVGGIIDNYFFELPSIKIGNVEVRNVAASYIPGAAVNLLGGSFLNKFKYMIDEKNKIIIFEPRTKVNFSDRDGDQPEAIILNGKDPDSYLEFKIREMP